MYVTPSGNTVVLPVGAGGVVVGTLTHGHPGNIGKVMPSTVVVTGDRTHG